MNNQSTTQAIAKAGFTLLRVSHEHINKDGLERLTIFCHLARTGEYIGRKNIKPTPQALESHLNWLKDFECEVSNAYLQTLDNFEYLYSTL